jgi:hypothetical protein
MSLLLAQITIIEYCSFVQSFCGLLSEFFLGRLQSTRTVSTVTALARCITVRVTGSDPGGRRTAAANTVDSTECQCSII